MDYLNTYFKSCGIISTVENLHFSAFSSFQGLVNDKDSKDSLTEGENLEEDEEEEEGGAETEEQSGNESEVRGGGK